MDPLSLLGAVVAAVQLLDVSITLSKNSRSFISSFKHAGEHVQLLVKVLQETESLMNDLQACGLIIQQCPPERLGPHSHVLRSSLTQIAANYAEDMRQLVKVIPSNTGLTFKQRVMFSREKQRTSDIMLRLEQRKTAASMALEILGRIDGIKQLNLGIEIQDQLKLLSIQQKALSDTIDECSTFMKSKSIQVEMSSEILERIKNLENFAVREESSTSKNSGPVSANCTHLSLSDDRPTRSMSISHQILESSFDLKDNLESQRIELRTMLDSMNKSTKMYYQNLASLSQESTISAASAAELGKIVRLELRRQLEPLCSQFQETQHIIDKLATSVATEASSLQAFEPNKLDKFHGKPMESVGIKSRAQQNGSVWKHSLKAKPEYANAVLFAYEKYIETFLGNLNLFITRYRVKGQCSYDPNIYFRLKVTFTPRPWLSSKGLSLMYSSGPNQHHHFDICPSIMTFDVIHPDSPLAQSLYDDDVRSIREAIHLGQLSLRDVNEYGLGLLELTMVTGGWNIFCYLLKETGYAEMLLSMLDEDSLTLHLMHTSSYAPNIEVARDIASLIYQHGSQWNPPDQGDYALIWNNLWAACRRTGYSIHESPFEKTQQLSLMFKEYRVPFDPDIWLMKPFAFPKLERERFLLRLYLRTDENPNHILSNGYPLIVAIFIYIQRALEVEDSIDEFKNSSMSEKGEFDISDDNDAYPTDKHRSSAEGGWNSDACFDNSDGYSASTSNSCSWIEGMSIASGLSHDTSSYAALLTLLISAGADIYWIWVDDRKSGHYHTLSMIASDHGVLDIWLAALDECGISLDDLNQGTKNRIRRLRKLRGAERTGVDIAGLIDEPSADGLRRRNWQRIPAQ